MKKRLCDKCGRLAAEEGTGNVIHMMLDRPVIVCPRCSIELTNVLSERRRNRNSEPSTVSELQGIQNNWARMEDRDEGSVDEWQDGKRD